ncbi:MAG TPA: hypothetical protein VET23_00805 [Chitinophagaceae bacterium]|nr:hypothetical protein [Chitinophagaceae bacterium]
MTNSNEPKATPENRKPAGKSYKNIIIGVLVLALLGTGGYLIAEKNKSGQVIEQQQSQIAKVTDEKSEIQRSFDGSLARLDSMAGINSDLNNKLSQKNTEITKTKAEIRSILNKKNVTTAELSKAKDLIASLNDKISTMEQEVARLTQDNQNLTQDKVVLTQEKEKLNQDLTATTVIKDDLTKKVDIASTLNASNIAITPVNVRKNDKERITSTAKRVDKLMISFDVNNRIAQAGMMDIYILVTGPDGKLISSEALGSGTFTTREQGDKPYSTKLSINVETATTKKVEYSFVSGEGFKKGNYKIQIYQNGFMIGEGTRELKKGGLFS